MCDEILTNLIILQVFYIKYFLTLINDPHKHKKAANNLSMFTVATK